MQKRDKKEVGTILLTLAMFLAILLGFTALGMEVGRWYLIRAELSKSVDAAALEGARNIGNPNVDPKTIAAEFSAENFPAGYLATPGSGTGVANFDIQLIGTNAIQVDGHVTAHAIMSSLFGMDLIPISSTGEARVQSVEIMLVLDRSGSMTANNGIQGVRDGANAFVDFFTDTQAQDKMGLISYATGVTVDRSLVNNFAASMHTKINALNANGWTNAEDAIDQANGPSGFTNQSGVPAADRVPQFMIFFTDGRANSFRYTFVRGGTTFDAVTQQNSNCDPGDQNNGLGNTLYNPTTGNPIANSNPIPTGDGKASGSACGGGTNTHWLITDVYGVNGYQAPYCSVPENSAMSPYVCGMAETLAQLHAKQLKDAGVVIYSVGLGADINETFLKQIATTPAFYYHATNGDDLTPIFQHIALDVKLRLVQ